MKFAEHRFVIIKNGLKVGEKLPKTLKQPRKIRPNS